MRLIATFKSHEEAQRASFFLKEKEVESQVDANAQNQFTLWVFEEDDIKKAQDFLKELAGNPSWAPSEALLAQKREEELLAQMEKEMSQEPSLDQMEASAFQEEPSEQSSSKGETPFKELQKPKAPFFGKMTLFISLACIALFFWSGLSTPKNAHTPNEELASSKLFTAPYSDLIYEFPLAYQYAEEFLSNLRQSENPTIYLQSAEAKQELYRFQTTPFWHGYYETYWVPAKSAPSLNKMFSPKPQFEQIAQGEVWRLFTPALLHGNFFHILFNLLWFVFLGRQVEERVGFWRFSLFLLLVAALSNTAQYLMSGPNFLGLSGIVMGLAGFIWMRQTKAAWEGYTIQKPTLYFLAFYILVLLVLQTASFVMELSGYKAIAPNIANTAHIVGACVGLVLGRLNFMSAWHLGKLGK